LPSINKTFNIYFGNLDYSPILRVTYTRGRIDTIVSPDEHGVARNM